MQGAGRHVQPVGRLVLGQAGGQGIPDQITDADHGVAVAPIKHADAAGCPLQEAGQRRFVAADRQVEQGGIEASGQLRAVNEIGTGSVDQRVVVCMDGPGEGKIHRIEGKAPTHEPARQAVEQAQQPFEGKYPGRVVGIPGEGRSFADAQFSPIVPAIHADAEVGQHDAEEPSGPVKTVCQGGGAQHAPAKELETARPHGRREQAEALVVQFADHQVVEGCIAVKGNPAGRVCKIDVEFGQKPGRVDVATQHSGQHAGYETH
jgi:hypothetical protein